jgi:hypothetical protein
MRISNGLENMGRSITILNVGAMNDEADHKANGIRNDMALSPLDLFPGVIA